MSSNLELITSLRSDQASLVEKTYWRVPDIQSQRFCVRLLSKRSNSKYQIDRKTSLTWVFATSNRNDWGGLAENRAGVPDPDVPRRSSICKSFQRLLLTVGISIAWNKEQQPWQEMVFPIAVLRSPLFLVPLAVCCFSFFSVSVPTNQPTLGQKVLADWE